MGFQGHEINFPKGKSIQNSAEYRNFRLRRHLDQSSEISGRSETRGEFLQRGGIFSRHRPDEKNDFVQNVLLEYFERHINVMHGVGVVYRTLK